MGADDTPCRVSLETSRHLDEQAENESLFEAYITEIEAHSAELAAEAIKDPKQLAQVLNDEQLVYDLTRIMSNLASANKEFSQLPLRGNWALCGLLQAVNQLEKKLLDLVNDEDWKEKASREVIPEA